MRQAFRNTAADTAPAKISSPIDNGDGTVTVSVTPAGSSRTWQVNGSNVSGATGNPQTLAVASGDEITCVVVPLAQTVSRTVFSVQVPPFAFEPLQPITEDARNSGTVTYPIKLSGGVKPYAVVPSFGTATATLGTIPLDSAQDRTVTVTATDAEGTERVQSFALTVNAPVIIPARIAYHNDADIDLVGTPGSPSGERDDIMHMMMQLGSQDTLNLVGFTQSPPDGNVQMYSDLFDAYELDRAHIGTTADDAANYKSAAELKALVVAGATLDAPTKGYREPGDDQYAEAHAAAQFLIQNARDYGNPRGDDFRTKLVVGNGGGFTTLAQAAYEAVVLGELPDFFSRIRVIAQPNFNSFGGSPTPIQGRGTPHAWGYLVGNSWTAAGTPGLFGDMWMLAGYFQFHGLNRDNGTSDATLWNEVTADSNMGAFLRTVQAASNYPGDYIRGGDAGIWAWLMDAIARQDFDPASSGNVMGTFRTYVGQLWAAQTFGYGAGSGIKAEFASPEHIGHSPTMWAPELTVNNPTTAAVAAIDLPRAYDMIRDTAVKYQVPVVATVPGQVTGLTATAGDEEVSLAWAEPSDGGSTITGYLVEGRTGASGDFSVLIASQSGRAYTDTGLTNGEVRDYRVSAINKIGTGAPSEAADATPRPAVEPAIPGLIAEWDTSGPADRMTDISGNGLDAIFGPGSAAPQRIAGEGLAFDGGDRAVVPADASDLLNGITDPLHILVFRRSVTDTTQILMARDNSHSGNRFQVRTVSGALGAVVRSSNTTSVATGIASVPLDEWVVVTSQTLGQTLILLRDGVEVDRTETMYSPDSVSIELTFGCRAANGYSEYFQGNLLYAATYDDPDPADRAAIEQRARDSVLAVHGIDLSATTPVDPPIDPPVEPPVTQGRIPQITTLTGGREAYTPKDWTDRVTAEAAANPDMLMVGSATRTASQSGPWSDTATWGGQSIPGENAIVSIPMGKTVTYDVESNAHLTDVRVAGGTLTWRTDVDTKLVVDTISSMMMGNVIIGDANEPITNSPTTGKPRAQIVFKAKSAPGPTPRLGMMTMGPIRIHGAKKTMTAEAVASMSAGQSTINFGTAPTGWRVGDQILVASTANYGSVENDPDGYVAVNTYWNDFSNENVEKPYGTWRDSEFPTSQDEVRTITAINGGIVTINTPLTYSHVGTGRHTLKSGDQIERRAVVSMLTHSIRFESDTPSGHRGHIMFMNENTDIRFAEARNMGRTRSDVTLVRDSGQTNNGIFTSDPDGSGRSMADTDNVRGRYPWHIHKTGPFFSKPMVVFEGLTAWASPGNPAQPGWGIVHHEARAAIEECVVFNVRGAGIVSEFGNEIGQWVNNWVYWARGDGLLHDWGLRSERNSNHNGHAGVAYECQARQVMMKGNGATSCRFGAIYMQQNPFAYDRIPLDVAMRIRDPFVVGAKKQYQTGDDNDTFGVEQAQIPPWDDQYFAACDVGFWVAHRQFVDLTDSTPMIAKRYVTKGVNTPFLLRNYSYAYYFYDNLYIAPTTGGGTAFVVQSDKSWGMSLANSHILGFDRIASLSGVNHMGFFTDITGDFPDSNNLFSNFRISGHTWDPKSRSPMWNVMGPSTIDSQGRYVPVPQRVWDSATDFPLPYPSGGNPASTSSQAPVDRDLPNPYPPAGVTFPAFELDPASSMPVRQTGKYNVHYWGRLHDAMGSREWPSGYVYSPTSSKPDSSHYSGLRSERQNHNAEGRWLVERNGCHEVSPGNWSMRMWHFEIDRATGEYFTFATEHPLIGTWDQQVLEDNRVDPDATKPTAITLPEAI